MTQKALAPAERLIVAADFKPPVGEGRAWVYDKVMGLADDLFGTGVYLKVNSALRACGYGMIEDIHFRNLGVFADLKLFDIPETLSADGMLLREVKPDLLTTVCTAGVTSMTALRAELPETEVLAVTVLTSLNDEEVNSMYSFMCESGEMPEVTALEAVIRFAHLAVNAGVGGVIASPKEIGELLELLPDGMSINTPGIRPLWSVVAKDDQKRVMTPAEAIREGAHRIVVGRPITQAKNPREAVERTLEEIAEALTT